MLFFIIYMFALFHPYLHRTSLSVTLETFSYSMFMIVHFAKFTKQILVTDANLTPNQDYY